MLFLAGRDLALSRRGGPMEGSPSLAASARGGLFVVNQLRTLEHKMMMVELTLLESLISHHKCTTVELSDT